MAELLNLDEIDQWAAYKVNQRSHSNSIQRNLEKKALEEYHRVYELTGDKIKAEKAYFKIFKNDDSKVNDGAQRTP